MSLDNDDDAAVAEPGLDPELAAEVLLTPSRVQEVASSSTIPLGSKQQLIARAFFQSASSNNLELLEYLVQNAQARALFHIEGTDGSGSPAIVLAAFSGLGDVVRLLLEAGADINARDTRGWTALMWAFQTNNLPLSSFLINRRASTTLRSHNGLAAIDLIRRGPEGDVYRSVLQDFEDKEVEQEEEEARSLHGSERRLSTSTEQAATRQPCRRSSVASLPGGHLPSTRNRSNSKVASKHTSLPAGAAPSTGTTFSPATAAAGSALERDQQMRLDLAMESAQNLDLDFSLLDISTAAMPSGNDMPDITEADEMEDGERGMQDGLEEGAAGKTPFDWEQCQTEEMLAFSIHDLPAILDLATEIRPSRQNEVRFLPANIVFLAARYASRFGGEDLLGELMIGAIDRIEASIHQHAEDLANSAFWLSNSILLLYYLRKDPQTAENTLEYQDNLHDLVREIFVFCIRDTERRLDKVLDGAMLEHEALPGFEDIRFEGEWRFVKALTARSKKDSFASLGSLSSLASHSPASRPSVMGLFASPDRATSMHFGNGTASTQGSPAGAPSPNKLVSARSRTPSTPMMRSGSGQITPMSAGKDTIELSPRSVTSILSSTLFILQHYDFAGHPCIVVQAFSQLLYWIASELFNRILTSAKKRHLCRSRAIQIRLNVSSLEDWARTNRLPVQMVSAHFKPLNELLQWLQCLSSESSIDGLLATMQNLKTLNPVQMRKAVKDYRYEVDEPKMSEECAQYLAQLHKDWERRRVLQDIENAEQEEAEAAARPSVSSRSSRTASEQSNPSSDEGDYEKRSHESSRTSDPRTDVERHIDEIFGGPLSSHSQRTASLQPGKSIYATYEPPERPECSNELLDSRVMLPFALPTFNEALVDYQREPFGPLHRSPQPSLRGPNGSTPIMRSGSVQCAGSDASATEAASLADVEPSLPHNFLAALREAKSRYFAEDVPPPRHPIGLGLPSHPRRASDSHYRHVSEVSSHGGGDKDDHWLNWRERMEEELAEAEALDADEVEGDGS